MAKTEGALFTVDWESWQDALHLNYKDCELLTEPTLYLLRVLEEHKIRAVFFVLSKTKWANHGLYKAIVKAGHIIKSHGTYHYRYEKADRKPYAWLGLTGGFWFRVLPYWLIKRNVEKAAHFYIHPHDIMTNHPLLNNPLLHFKRHVGLKNARPKLERLLKDVRFRNADSGSFC